MYLFWSTTVFLGIINKYDLPAIKSDFETATHGCYTHTLPWFLTNADKGQGVLCHPPLIYILCFKNKIRPSWRLLLSNTINWYVTDHELAGSKSGLTHLDFGVIASQILKLLGYSLRQLHSTSEMPTTSKDSHIFSSTRGDHSITNAIINSLRTA